MMDSTEDSIDVLGTEIDSNKKSFFIRDILQSSSNNFHNSDTRELVTNERLISWILQNQNKDCLEQIQESDSETDSLTPILNEMTKCKFCDNF